MVLRKLLALFSVYTVGMLLVGCQPAGTSTTTHKTVDDKLWANGELRIIVNATDYVGPAFSLHGSGARTRQRWDLITIPILDQPNRDTKRQEFSQIKGDFDHFFLCIRGSDLLLHQVLSNTSARQFFLFDPMTGKDVSKAFPSKQTDQWIPNRSRTAGLMAEENQLVIVDILSAAQGEPKILARPLWDEALDRLEYGKFTAVLTDDARHLVLLPYIKSGRNVGTSNYVSEVWSIDGSMKKYFLPPNRKEGDFVDAEWIDGKVWLLWRSLLSNGEEDAVELLNTAGQTLHSGKISAFTVDHSWNTERHEVLFPYYEGPSWDGETARTFYVWNYSSNSVQRITGKR